MLRINEQRLLDDLNALAQVGGTDAGGVSRPAMSEADVQGRLWFRNRAKEAGLEYRSDGAGNLSAVLRCANPAARTLLAGSHLDSVPNGGRYDGALGMLCALEAVRTIQESAFELPVHLEVISFTDEEGEIYGLFGSRAFTGALTAADLEHSRATPEITNAGFQRLGITKDSVLAAGRNPADYLAFVELHIQQGTRLEEAGIDAGVVTQIVGIRSMWLRFQGEAAHAGTMPMDRRRDALWGASEFVRRGRERVISDFTPGVMNCGQLYISPGAFNIVPAEVRLALEFRHGTDEHLDIMEKALLDLAHEVAREYGLTLDVESASYLKPALMDEHVIAAIEYAAETLGLSSTRLMSFAGHDTQSISRIMPAAMFFVPSVKGISHNPHEFTRNEDVINGANILLQTLLRLIERIQSL